MRLQSWCATVFVAAAGLLHGVAADETTYTIFRTVERVVDTTTMWSSASSQATLQPSGWGSNSTSAAATGTAKGNPSTVAWPSMSATKSVPIVHATGAASNLRLDAAGLAAIAGIAGLVAL